MLLITHNRHPDPFLFEVGPQKAKFYFSPELLQAAVCPKTALERDDTAKTSLEARYMFRKLVLMADLNPIQKALFLWNDLRYE